MIEANYTSATSSAIIKNFDQLKLAWNSSKNNQAFSSTLKRTAKYWWNCEKMHSFERDIYKQLANGCPLCSPHIFAPGQNDFKTQCIAAGRQDILAQWSSYNEKGPESATNKTYAWWQCKNEHIWWAEAGSRLTRKCPSCSRKRLEKGYNDLETYLENNTGLQHLFSEWNETKNGAMINYTCKSGQSVWWNCRNHHSWLATIANRTNGDGCSKCRESGTERSIRDFIENITGEAKPDTSILEGKEIDIFIPHLLLGIEVNGNYWHSDKFLGRTNAALEKHLWKLEKALTKGVTLLYVWEDDWKLNRVEVEKALRRAIDNKTDIDPRLKILSKG